MTQDEDDGFYVSAPKGQPAQAAGPKKLEVTGEVSYAPPSGAVDMPWSEALTKGVISFPSSAVDVAKSTVQPFLNPIETAESLGLLGKGLYSKAKGAVGFAQDPEQKARDEAAANAVGEYFGDRYGTKAGFKRAVATDLAGVIADLSVPFTLGGGAAARVPGAIGKVGEAAKIAGTYMDPLTLGIKGTAAATELAAKNLAAPVMALKSGASVGSLRDAFDAGYNTNKEFMRHYLGKGSQDEVIDAVTGAIRDVAKDRSDAYLRGMSGLNSQAQLPYTDIVNTLGAAKNSHISPGGTKNKTAIAALAEAENEINQWQNQTLKAGSHTIADMDGLKQALDEIRAKYKGDPKAYQSLTDVRNSVRNTIAAVDPKYANIMESYADASRRLHELRTEFRTNSNVPINKQMRAIIKARDSLHGDKFIEQIAAKNPDIPYMIAGQELSQLKPYGTLAPTIFGGQAVSQALPYILPSIIGKVDPTTMALHALTLPATSPKFNAGLLATTGLAAKGIDKIGEGVSKVPMFVKAPMYGVGRTAEEAADDGSYPRPVTIRPNRARGGAVTAESLVAAAEKAKKAVNKTTEPLLEKDDTSVARALEVANRHIEG
jgi:hypothetical protein